MKGYALPFFVLLSLLGLLNFAWASPQPTPAEAPSLRLVVEGSPRQGGILFVSVVTSEGEVQGKMDCLWLKKRYPTAENNPPRSVLPVPVDAAVGPHRIDLVDSGGNVWVSANVTIGRTAFPHQSIWLSPSMLALYDSPQSKIDDEKLLEALRKFTPDKLWSGSFIQPAAGPRTTQFGAKRTYNGGARHSWHHGQDLAVGTGTPVHATNGGIVGLTAYGMHENGNAVVLQHGWGIGSLYLHLSRIEVKPGQKVRKGQVIGLSGASGAGTGPHLHWGCYVGGTCVDPAVLENLPADWR